MSLKQEHIQVKNHKQVYVHCAQIKVLSLCLIPIYTYSDTMSHTAHIGLSYNYSYTRLAKSIHNIELLQYVFICFFLPRSCSGEGYQYPRGVAKVLPKFFLL